MGTRHAETTMMPVWLGVAFSIQCLILRIRVFDDQCSVFDVWDSVFDSEDLCV